MADAWKSAEKETPVKPVEPMHHMRSAAAASHPVVQRWVPTIGDLDDVL